jgi:hypothetical protein
MMVELEGGLVPDGFTLTIPTRMGSTQETADGTIYASPAVDVGTYEVEVQAREVGGVFSLRSIRVVVTGGGGSADFSVEVDPQTTTIQAGSAHTFGYQVSPLNGFSGTVAVTLTGLTDDLDLRDGVLSAPTLDFPPGSVDGHPPSSV